MLARGGKATRLAGRIAMRLKRGLEIPFLGHQAERLADLLDTEGLPKVIERAQFHGVQRGIHRGVPGEHHHEGPGPTGPHLVKELETRSAAAS